MRAIFPALLKVQEISGTPKSRNSQHELLGCAVMHLFFQCSKFFRSLNVLLVFISVRLSRPLTSPAR